MSEVIKDEEKQIQERQFRLLKQQIKKHKKVFIRLKDK